MGYIYLKKLSTTYLRVTTTNIWLAPFLHRFVSAWKATGIDSRAKLTTMCGWQHRCTLRDQKKKAAVNKRTTAKQEHDECRTLFMFKPYITWKIADQLRKDWKQRGGDDGDDDDDAMNDEGDECESRAPTLAFTTTGMRASGGQDSKIDGWRQHTRWRPFIWSPCFETYCPIIWCMMVFINWVCTSDGQAFNAPVPVSSSSKYGTWQLWITW